MCLLVFSYKQHPQYHLILAANRDEDYARPTRAAQFWEDHPYLLAGKDETRGGTWMGITQNGSFSALTNYRDPTLVKKDGPSRGHLVLNFLIEADSPLDYLEKVDRKAGMYSGFNLLVGNQQQLGYYSNQQQEIRPLMPGLYGLSNHLLDTPWPKVKTAKQELKKIVGKNTVSIEDLFELLADEREANEEELPDTGISSELEKKVSPIFIKSDSYGTRSSSVLLIDQQGTVTFEERRFQAGSLEIEGTSRYEFQLKN